MGTYNTKGVLLEKPAVSSGKAGDANAQVKAADTQIEAIDALQMLLDVIGLIPGAGAPADLLNGIISAARGDWLGAGLSLFGVIPIAGEAATVAKIAKNSEKYIQALDVVAKKVVPHLPASMGKKVEEAIAAARTKIDEIAGKKPKPKPDEAPKSKDEGKDGGKVKKEQEPHKDCGKVSTYRKAPKKLGELNADHLPSGGALKEAARRQLNELGLLNSLTPKQIESVLNKVYNNAQTITIPEDVHKEGRTYGSKNKPLISSDSKDLSGAFKRDADAVQKSMDTKDHGCSEK